MDSIAGYDEYDPNSLKAPKKHEYFEETVRASDLASRTIGVPRKFFLDLVDREVRETFEGAGRLGGRA